jgi:hypothetical protein
MNDIININFNFFSDTPTGEDPDKYSPTLRRYHKLLWSKQLPNDVSFELSDTTPGIYLHHQSALGKFFLSSDAIGHTFRGMKRMAHITDQIPPDEIDSFFAACCTIGGYVIFPSNKVENKMTINGSRGFNHSISDRIDLTLECIRRRYGGEDNPLNDTLNRYAEFFGLFGDFKGYVDFFLFQDLVAEDYSTIRFFLPFDGFTNSPLPQNVEEYQLYKTNMIEFVSARNQRVLDSIH